MSAERGARAASPLHRGALVARGAAASAVMTLLAAISHTLGGGAAPAPLIVIGMIVVLVLPIGWMTAPRQRAGRTRSPDRAAPVARIAVTTTLAQLAFHGAFTALGAPVAGMPVAGSHAHGSVALLDASAGGALPAAHDHADTPWMAAAHVIAAVFTIAIIAYGETTLRRGWRWARAVLRALLTRPVLPDAPRLVSASARRIRAMHVATPATGLRGPPLVS